MKRTIAVLSFCGMLAIAALAQTSHLGVKAISCHNCCQDKCGQSCCQDGCTDSCCQGK